MVSLVSQRNLRERCRSVDGVPSPVLGVLEGRQGSVMGSWGSKGGTVSR